jgi:hypothetical protein
MDIDRNTPIWQLTLGDFLQAFQKYTEPSNKIEIETVEKKEYVYGINGLADLIGCSKTHASRLKSQGIFDEAIIQRGRTIIIDKEKALELFNNKL